MQNKRNIPVWVSVLLVALCAGVIVFDVIGIAKCELNPVCYISYIVYALTVIFSGFYCATGFRKESASYYSFAVILYAVCQLIVVVSSGVVGIMFGELPLIPIAISYGCLCILAAAKDLGKTKSLVLWAVVFAASLFWYIFSIAKFGFLISDGYQLSNILCAVILGIMLFAKYRDKEARGAK